MQSNSIYKNVGATALTYEEIGMNVDGMTLQIEGEDKVEIQPTDKRAVFTFELQSWQIKSVFWEITIIFLTVELVAGGRIWEIKQYWKRYIFIL